jgi:membrane protein YqaA with SNARE-associated domain
MLARLIAALHRWAESGWAGTATATWEVMQGSFMPGPSGAVFAPLAVADPPRAPRLALWGAVGSIVGGCIAFTIGAFAFEELGRPVLSLLGVSAGRLASTEAAFDRHGLLIVFASTISPLSTKLVCIAAGAFGLPVATFLPALIVGRAIRFAALTIILRFAGEKLTARLSRRVAGSG